MTTAPPPPTPTGPPQPPVSPTGPRRSFFRTYRAEAMILGALLLFALSVVAPTWLFGGFEQQPRQKLPVVEVGTTVKYGQFKIKPVGARLLDENPKSAGEEKKGHVYLAAQVTVENLTKEPAYNFDQLMLLGKPVFTKRVPPEDTMVVRDGGSVTTLMPRVPETLELIWLIPEESATKITERVDITLQRRHWRESFFEQEMKWTSPTPWYTVDMPVVREDQ